jgi:DNA primase catalytic core
MYTKQSIDRVREADIVTVVSHYCKDLTKKGANYFCKSPFKDEKTASLSVSPTKEIFKCFGTGIGGDALKFVMEVDKCEFIEAVKTIAGICNIILEEEIQSEEVKQAIKQQTSLVGLANNIAKKYHQNFRNLPANHWAKKHIANLGYDDSILIEFNIGFAFATNEITTALIDNAKLAAGVNIGVCKSDNNKTYDFYKERIMFPICNKNGDTISFGGRRQNGEEFNKYAKYLNGAETELYKKEENLYGYNLAKRSIAKSGFAILCEGYTDVITMHQKEATQTIATCGTALTEIQAKKLKRICDHVILFRDGDVAGVKASIRDLEILIKHGFRVSIVPLDEDTDPDEFARGQINVPAYIEEYRIDAIEWYLYKLQKEAEDDPHAIAKVVTETAALLFKITNTVVQDAYVKVAAKVLKQSQRVLKHQISELTIARQSEIEAASGGKGISKDTLGLPKGADQEQFLKDRFCIVGNSYHFTKGNGFYQGTQFKITPLFHIKGKKDNKRLCEVTNMNNQKQLIDLESDSFVNFSDFKKQLIRLGYFIFLSGTSTSEFDLLAQKILREFNTALELQNMGWNGKGFFAFANGVYWKDKFREVNKYGIIHLEGVDTAEEDEYNEKVEYYYSPAYSAMHVKNQDGDDPYENDRKFIYKKAPITLQNWMEQFLTVFEEKGRIGILFNFATLFRDLFLTNYDFFPLLGGFGEKGSGKSAFGKVLQNFFFYNLDALELNTSTLVGFSRRLSRTKNTTVFLDEYHDRLDEKMFQAMKGAHQGMGREKGMATNDNRTKTDKINCSIYIAGQYLPTRDDNSLQSRLISLQFPLGNKTSEQRANFTKLMNSSTAGLSSLILEVIEHRQLFEDAIGKTYNEVVRELKEVFDTPGKEQEYEERILGNYAVLLITYKILESRITFPFSYEAIFKQSIEGIIENSEAIQDSNGLTEFWNILQWMYEHRFISEGFQFIIDSNPEVKTIGSQKKTEVYRNTEMKEILYLRLNSVHQDYTKECTKREGIQPIGETTLRNYFKSRTYFIGLVKGKYFKNGGSSSCYAFDYEAMKRNNIISLDPLPKASNDEASKEAKSPKEDEDLPF